MDQQTPPVTQSTQTVTFPTDRIPEKIKEWLASDTVFDITQELNTRFKITGAKKAMIAFTVTKVLIKKIPVTAFVKTLVEQGGLSERDALEIASVIRARVLDPVRAAILEWSGIDTSKIVTPATVTAAARTMPIEKPIVKPPVAAQTQTPRPAGPPPPPVPKARVMEMSQVIDVRKPMATAASTKATTPSVVKQTSPAPTAQTMKIEGDFSAGGPVKAVAPAPKPAGPAAAPKPAGESDVLETKKEFGLAEAVPKPPQPQEIEKYEDHHPVVE